MARTTQNTLEQRLAISEERLNIAQKAAKMGTFEWNLKTNKFSWSDELLALYGRSSQKTTNHVAPWIKFLHPADRKRVLATARRAAKAGKEFREEFRIVWPDKSVHYILARAQVFKNGHGKPLRMVGVNLDVTQRKYMEMNLQFLAEASKILSSSLDYQTTLHTVSHLAVPEIADWCAVDILDTHGKIQQVAVAHKDPKKVRWAKELRKKSPPDMKATQGLPHVIRTGKPELYPLISDEVLVAAAKDEQHLKLLRKIGFTSAMIAPLYRNKKCIGAITFVTTETRRRYTDSDLSMAMELASRASLAIENAWLYQGSQDAIALRDNFISVASHELKTPITSVKLFTQVLQRHSQQIGDAKAAEHLGKMDQQINKLTELVYTLLDISKIRAGRIEFVQQRFDFDQLTRETVSILQHSAPKHQLILRGKTGKKVYGDPDRISQVLSNLISNAIKYSPRAKKVVITRSVTPKDVVVCVEDFGVGIPNEHLERIFERFYRVFDSNDKTFPGLGIGLYISAEIVQRHYGKVWVESQVGKGSKFYFALPLRRPRESKGVTML